MQLTKHIKHVQKIKTRLDKHYDIICENNISSSTYKTIILLFDFAIILVVSKIKYIYDKMRKNVINFDREEMSCMFLCKNNVQWT